MQMIPNFWMFIFLMNMFMFYSMLINNYFFFNKKL